MNQFTLLRVTYNTNNGSVYFANLLLPEAIGNNSYCQFLICQFDSYSVTKQMTSDITFPNYYNNSKTNLTVLFEYETKNRD